MSATVAAIYLYVVLRGSMEDNVTRYPMTSTAACMEAIRTSRHTFSPTQTKESGVVMFCAGERQRYYTDRKWHTEGAAK